jgi:hypothetical protein
MSWKSLVKCGWLLPFAFLLVADCGGGGPARDVCEGDATCNGRGTCDDSSGAVVCTCDQGWGGSRCDQCDAGYQDYGDGECRPSDPCADASCAAENRECTNDQGTAVCGDCLAGYHDEGGVCIADTACQPTSCSGHGVCDDSTTPDTRTTGTGSAGRPILAPPPAARRRTASAPTTRVPRCAATAWPGITMKAACASWMPPARPPAAAATAYATTRPVR